MEAPNFTSETIVNLRISFFLFLGRGGPCSVCESKSPLCFSSVSYSFILSRAAVVKHGKGNRNNTCDVLGNCLFPELVCSVRPLCLPFILGSLDVSLTRQPGNTGPRERLGAVSVRVPSKTCQDGTARASVRPCVRLSARRCRRGMGCPPRPDAPGTSLTASSGDGTLVRH